MQLIKSHNFLPLICLYFASISFAETTAVSSNRSHAITISDNIIFSQLNNYTDELKKITSSDNTLSEYLTDKVDQLNGLISAPENEKIMWTLQKVGLWISKHEKNILKTSFDNYVYLKGVQSILLKEYKEFSSNLISDNIKSPMLEHKEQKRNAHNLLNLIEQELSIKITKILPSNHYIYIFTFNNVTSEQKKQVKLIVSKNSKFKNENVLVQQFR